MNATIDSILACSEKPGVQSIDVPEMGGTVYVRELTGSERDAFERDWLEWRRDENHDEKDWAGFHAFVVMYLLCTVSRVQQFPNDRESVFKLQKLPARLLSKVARFALKVNAMGAEAEEEAAKNYAAGRTCNSGSASPDTSSIAA